MNHPANPLDPGARFDAAPLFERDCGQQARTIEIVPAAGFDAWAAELSPRARTAVAAHGVTGKAGASVILPEDAADAWRVALVVADPALGVWDMARLAETLPAGRYRLRAPAGASAAHLGWALGQYRFGRYLKPAPSGARILVSAEPAAVADAVAEAGATGYVRDLVNLPAADLGPAELEAETGRIGALHGAESIVTRGDALRAGYPMIDAVGRAAAATRQPRLIELGWGNPAHPRIAIVGKGVCFDSGGLDIKPSSGMRLMKKDMGGAAHALALAELVMAARLPVRLHLLIPAVENAISADAFRPGDVLATRAGLTVENSNTDAEGRLVLGDALTRAVEQAPALIVDFATLTGAARVALGPDLPATFVNDEALASALLAAARDAEDPLWRMPLWDGYDDMLASDIADLVNAPDGGFAGAVTAALFLRRFVPSHIPWAHLDTFAWRPAAKPGRPRGGEALGLRAVWTMLRRRFG